MMLTSRLSAPARTWLSVGLVAVATLMLIALYRPFQQPWNRDDAYLLYMAQGMLRGEPVYQTTTFGYGPFSALMNATVMGIGGLFGLPTHLSPRLAAPLVLVGSVLLTAVVATRMSGKRWVGLCAALFYLAFEAYVILNFSLIEPKLIVQFCALVMIASLQGRRWLLAGAALGTAVTTWQPAFILVSAPLAVGIPVIRREGWRPALTFIAGGLLGTLPALLYLVLTGQLGDFIQQGLLLKLQNASIVSQRQRSFWINFMLRYKTWGLAKLSLPLSVIGFASVFVRSFKQSTVWRVLTSPEWGGVAALTVAWFSYNTYAYFRAVESLGAEDYIPFQYLIPIWAALACAVGIEILGKWLGERWTRAASVMLPLLFAGVVLVQGMQYQLRYTFEAQQALLTDSLEDPNGSWLAVNLPEFYTLYNRPNPWRLLQFNLLFGPFIEQRLPGGCETLLNDLGNYRQIVIDPSIQQPCLLRIDEALTLQRDQFTSVVRIVRDRDMVP